MPYSKIVKAIAKLLVKEGYLADVKDTETDGRKTITVGIRYVRRKAIISDVEIVSKPSLRAHMATKELQAEQRKKTLMLVVSTSQGLMTSKQALQKGIGGELLFKIG